MVHNLLDEWINSLCFHSDEVSEDEGEQWEITCLGYNYTAGKNNEKNSLHVTLSSL